MPATSRPSVQVLVEEDSYQVKKGPSHAKKQGFKHFIYTHGKNGAGKFTEFTSPLSQTKTDHTITVFRFDKVDDINRARKLVKKYSVAHKPMIAITSPGIYNLPKFRSILKGDHLEVIVEEKQNFKISHLDEWVSKLVRKPTKRRPLVRQKISHQPLDLSARLRDPATGRLDARKLIELLGITGTALATKVCGISKQALNQNPFSIGIQDKLQPLEEIAQLLSWCGGDENKLRAWLHRPNRDFAPVDGKVLSPMELILLGYAEVVTAKVNNLRNGHPS